MAVENRGQSLNLSLPLGTSACASITAFTRFLQHAVCPQGGYWFTILIFPSLPDISSFTNIISLGSEEVMSVSRMKMRSYLGNHIFSFSISYSSFLCLEIAKIKIIS